MAIARAFQSCRHKNVPLKPRARSTRTHAQRPGRGGSPPCRHEITCTECGPTHLRPGWPLRACPRCMGRHGGHISQRQSSRIRHACRCVFLGSRVPMLRKGPSRRAYVPDCRYAPASAGSRLGRPWRPAARARRPPGARVLSRRGTQLPMFGKFSLVFGCIGADLCKKICVL